ncbi:MORN (Membrane Occupation and Recognition Nexus)repeat-containing protein [Striga asiatica]|uniref:MORN (Membrane Occupation and Recognition Nexus)repeat-containing protein n=1 Tax=Striga asiatica TaxID=4170 RepID=A0A5A7NYL3_STRAF|nr:MORN (Membrane Occupation and Recognition Nexus)repeat-containing protein [Striga asiatica]
MDPVPWFDNFLWNHDLPMIMGCEWSKATEGVIFLRMAPGIRKTQIISKAALESMLNQATKDSSTTASARIGVREHFNQSNVSSAGVTGACGTTEVNHGSSGEGDNTTTNHTNESGIPQTLETPNPNQNLNAAEGSTGNLQDTSVTGSYPGTNSVQKDAQVVHI